MLMVSKKNIQIDVDLDTCERRLILFLVHRGRVTHICDNKLVKNQNAKKII